MSEKEVFMDTGIFTEIVEDIRGVASDFTLTETPLDGAKALCGITGGRKMYKVLEEMYRTDYIYNTVASVSLPIALLKTRDSMIAVDQAASESLSVNKDKFGGTKR